MAFKVDPAEQKDLDDFLSKVDNLEKIMNGLSSGDLDTQHEAIAKADEMLKKESITTFNKTIINKKAFEDDGNDKNVAANMPFTNPSMSQDAFLSALEEDANARAKARKIRQEKANKVKEKANEAFRSGEYEVADKLYAEAISCCKDMTVLYTNRAMARIQLHMFKEAIDDCEFAMRIDETWAKAYILKGNSLRALKKFDDAITTYREMLKYHKNKEKVLDKYIQETEEEREEHELEKSARKGLEEQDSCCSVTVKLIDALRTRVEPKCESREMTMSCNAATVKMLAGQIEDNLRAQVLFRQEGGFKIIAVKPTLKGVLLQKSFSMGSESDFARAMLILIQAACAHCPQNIKAFFQEPDAAEIIRNLLSSKDRQVKHAAIVCFFEFAANNKMIELVSQIFSVSWILSSLLHKDIVKLKLLTEAVATLNKYAENEAFRNESATEFDSIVLPLYHQFIDEIGHNQRKDLPLCIQSICIFLRNDTIRKIVSSNAVFWNSCLTCVEKVIQVLEPNQYREEMLSRMLDITEYIMLHECSTTRNVAPRLTNCLLPALNWKGEIIVQKAMTTIARCLERSRECVKCFGSSTGMYFIKKIYKTIGSDNPYMRSYGLKIICYVGQTQVSILRNIPKFDKKYAILRRALYRDETEVDTVNQGHAGILFGFLSELPGGMDPLADNLEIAGDVVKYLLDLTRNAEREHTRVNCTIAVGKMASNDIRMLTEVHRFDGINILSKNKPPGI